MTADEALELRTLVVEAGIECPALKRAHPMVHCGAEIALHDSPLFRAPRALEALVGLMEDRRISFAARRYAAERVAGVAHRAHADIASRILTVAEAAPEWDQGSRFVSEVGFDVATVAAVSPEIAARVEALLRNHRNAALMEGLLDDSPRGPRLLAVAAERFVPVLLDVGSSCVPGFTERVLLSLARGTAHLSSDQQARACAEFVAAIGNARCDGGARSAGVAGLWDCRGVWDDGLTAMASWMRGPAPRPNVLVPLFLHGVLRGGTETQRRAALEVTRAIADRVSDPMVNGHARQLIVEASAAGAPAAPIP